MKEVVEYKLSISNDKSFLFGAFAFDLQTCAVEYLEYSEAYAAGVHHPKFLSECFNGDITDKKLTIEKSKAHVFDRENGNPVSKVFDHVVNNYKGHPKQITKKYGKRVMENV